MPVDIKFLDQAMPEADSLSFSERKSPLYSPLEPIQATLPLATKNCEECVI